MIYKVAKEGYYEVSASFFVFKKTGVFETVKNPKSKWWKFWEPKTIVREIYKTETVVQKSQFYLSKGQEFLVGDLLQKFIK